MSYQVLARKWRPKNFQTMVGQEHVVQALTNAFKQQRLHHAYLFTGTRGVGKTTLGRIIAKCLNCESGITPEPCGKCTTCQEIEQGNYIDLLEIDAASRTKVEDTRELLDNVPYAPTHGRFKIYLIDEVHMLSSHSFNALLKTLEEPPTHVKFILATTDPQKLPITVLSRCLQFHLHNLIPEKIATHLQYVLAQENIAFEKEALLILARVADGSMRDALSLLDQAIAYCNSSIQLSTIQNMLGLTPANLLLDMLDAIENQDSTALISIGHQLNQQGVDYHHTLADLLSLLHQITWAQCAPQTSDNPSISALAKRISKENVQLYYQIVLSGKRDLPLAPTPRVGFEMIILRLLAFKPAEKMSAPTSPPISKKQSATPAANQNKTTPNISASSDKALEQPLEWSAVLSQLKLTGMTQILAANCAIKSFHSEKIALWLDPTQAPLLNANQQQRLQQALSEHFGKSIQLSIEIAQTPIASPTREQQKQTQQQRDSALSTLSNDPQVKDLLQSFNANIDLDSVTPINKED